MQIMSFQDWIGRQTQDHDLIHTMQMAGLSATLDRADAVAQAGDTLPDLWHWLYFNTLCLRSSLGADGHPARGNFLPPVPLPRRMWAGGELTFIRPVTVGETIKKTSTITNITHKSGRTGQLVFVEVEHVLSDAAGELVRERQDIVYRDHPAPDSVPPMPVAAPMDALWRRTVTPDTTLLFRYSALTGNGHRIHYDKPYASEVEGYPDLVVHGPLLATLLLDLLRHVLPHAHVRHFAFKAHRPTFLGNAFEVCANYGVDQQHIELWTQDHAGCLTMSASVVLA